MNETELLIEYCKSWNNLDTSFIEPYLADNLEYNSMWVFDTIIGKDAYLDYLKGKFETISNDIVNAKVIADIGYFKHEPFAHNRPCIVLTQLLNKKINKVTILIEFVNDKINKIDLCCIPNPNRAELFKIEPK